MGLLEPNAVVNRRSNSCTKLSLLFQDSQYAESLLLRITRCLGHTSFTYETVSSAHTPLLSNSVSSLINPGVLSFGFIVCQLGPSRAQMLETPIWR